jgi:poly(hydroxyalkanoate) granule-associated protein
MATKALKNKVQAKPAASKPAAPVVTSVRDIWLAGIGAFAVVQQEGGRLADAGSKLFGKFVAEGVRFEGRTRDLAEEAVDDIRDGVESTVGSMRRQATDRLHQLEDTLGFGVTETLNRLGIPTTGDLDEVATRFQKMSRQVNENWKGLNKAVDGRVRAVVGKLDVPKTEELNKLAQSFQRFSKDTVDNLVRMENSFEQRVAGLMRNMEVPTAEEFAKISTGLQQLSEQLTAQLNRLEGEFEARVTGIMERLGVPTRDEIGKLSDSVAELTLQIAALDKPAAGTQPRPAARKKPAKKA